MDLWLGLGCGLGLCVAYFLYTRKKLCDKFSQIPGETNFSTVISRLMGKTQILQKPLLILDLKKKYGRLFKQVFLLENFSFVYVMDPELIKEVLLRKDMLRAPFKTNDPITPGVANLFSSQGGSEWKMHRTIASHAFTDSQLSRTVDTHVCEVASRLVKKWSQMIDSSKSGVAEPEISQESKHYTLDIIGLAGFGYEIDSLRQPTQYVEIVNTIMEKLVWTFLLPPWAFSILLHTPVFKKLKEHAAIWKGLLNRLINERESTPLDMRRDKNDLLEMLMSAKHNSEETGYTNQDLLADLNVFMIAGHETTSALVAHSLAFLATNPQAQEKCRAEIDSMFGKSMPTFQQLEEAKYVNCVVKETLRLKAAAGQTIKFAAQDFVLGQKYQIPKGTGLVIPIWGMHYNEDYWQEPYAFKPERFLDQRIETGTFVPFSLGPRQCIGHKLATSEAAICIINVLQNFTIYMREEDRKKIRDVNAFTIQPSPFTIQVRRR